MKMEGGSNKNKLQRQRRAAWEKDSQWEERERWEGVLEKRWSMERWWLTPVVVKLWFILSVFSGSYTVGVWGSLLATWSRGLSNFSFNTDFSSYKHCKLQMSQVKKNPKRRLKIAKPCDLACKPAHRTSKYNTYILTNLTIATSCVNKWNNKKKKTEPKILDFKPHHLAKVQVVGCKIIIIVN